MGKRAADNFDPWTGIRASSHPRLCPAISYSPRRSNAAEDAPIKPTGRVPRNRTPPRPAQPQNGEGVVSTDGHICPICPSDARPTPPLKSPPRGGVKEQPTYRKRYQQRDETAMQTNLSREQLIDAIIDLASGHHVAGEPYRYKHGWIKLGMEVEHKDGSKGKVERYDPNTQTAHISWHAGARSKKNGGKGTTKAYHLVRKDGGEMVEPRSNVKEPATGGESAAKDLGKLIKDGGKHYRGAPAEDLARITSTPSEELHKLTDLELGARSVMEETNLRRIRNDRGGSSISRHGRASRIEAQHQATMAEITKRGYRAPAAGPREEPKKSTAPVKKAESKVAAQPTMADAARERLQAINEYNKHKEYALDSDKRPAGMSRTEALKKAEAARQILIKHGRDPGEVKAAPGAGTRSVSVVRSDESAKTPVDQFLGRGSKHLAAMSEDQKYDLDQHPAAAVNYLPDDRLAAWAKIKHDKAAAVLNRKGASPQYLASVAGGYKNQRDSALKEARRRGLIDDEAARAMPDTEKQDARARMAEQAAEQAAEQTAERELQKATADYNKYNEYLLEPDSRPAGMSIKQVQEGLEEARQRMLKYGQGRSSGSDVRVGDEVTAYHPLHGEITGKVFDFQGDRPVVNVKRNSPVGNPSIDTSIERDQIRSVRRGSKTPLTVAPGSEATYAKWQEQAARQKEAKKAARRSKPATASTGAKPEPGDIVHINGHKGFTGEGVLQRRVGSHHYVEVTNPDGSKSIMVAPTRTITNTGRKGQLSRGAAIDGIKGMQGKA